MNEANKNNKQVELACAPRRLPPVQRYMSLSGCTIHIYTFMCTYIYIYIYVYTYMYKHILRDTSPIRWLRAKASASWPARCSCRSCWCCSRRQRNLYFSISILWIGVRFVVYYFPIHNYYNMLVHVIIRVYGFMFFICLDGLLLSILLMLLAKAQRICAGNIHIYIYIYIYIYICLHIHTYICLMHIVVQHCI